MDGARACAGYNLATHLSRDNILTINTTPITAAVATATTSTIINATNASNLSLSFSDLRTTRIATQVLIDLSSIAHRRSWLEKTFSSACDYLSSRFILTVDSFVYYLLKFLNTKQSITN